MATKPTGRPPVYCGKDCRQRAFRLRGRRRVSSPLEEAAPRIRVAYADPPYPGKAARYYRNEPTYAGEVDHRQLVSSLLQDYPDGWALSTSMEGLWLVLPLVPRPPRAHVCPWVKPNGVSRRTRGLHTTWEALIVVGGRQRAPGLRDWLCAKPAIGGGTLMGRKPLAYCAFLFDALGLEPGDELVDLFPGTGIVARAWSNLCGSSATFRRPRQLALRDVDERRNRGDVGGQPGAISTPAGRSPGGISGAGGRLAGASSGGAGASTGAHAGLEQGLTERVFVRENPGE